MTAELFAFPELTPPAIEIKREKKKTAGYSTEFEAFWLAYPRKLNCSKFEASKSWARLPTEMQEQAMAALPVFSTMMRGKDEQYICHAATWLNQRRFETISPAIKPQETINIDWPTVLRIYAKTNNWNPAYGPEPGQLGYKGPDEM